MDSEAKETISQENEERQERWANSTGKRFTSTSKKAGESLGTTHTTEDKATRKNTEGTTSGQAIEKPAEDAKTKKRTGRPTDTVVPTGDVLAKTGFKIPGQLLDAVRALAWLRHSSMNTVASEAIGEYIRKEEEKLGFKLSMENLTVQPLNSIKVK